jgi:hypothetical protein
MKVSSGDRVWPYEILTLLGGGGMGEGMPRPRSAMGPRGGHQDFRRPFQRPFQPEVRAEG